METRLICGSISTSPVWTRKSIRPFVFPSVVRSVALRSPCQSSTQVGSPHMNVQNKELKKLSCTVEYKYMWMEICPLWNQTFNRRHTVCGSLTSHLLYEKQCRVIVLWHAGKNKDHRVVVGETTEQMDWIWSAQTVSALTRVICWHHSIHFCKTWLALNLSANVFSQMTWTSERDLIYPLLTFSQALCFVDWQFTAV